MTTEKTPQSPLLEKKEPKLMDDGYQSINRSNDHVGDTSFTQSRRSLIISRCMALACVGFAVIDWVVLAEMLQKLQQPDASGKKYDKPMFLCFCIKTAYAISFVPYLIWKYTPLGGEGRKDAEPFNHHYLFTRACILNMMGYISGYTWYMSLPITSVSANTAIYMCACAAVFLISIPVLREKITPIKVGALLTCCTGIVLVSMFSSTEQSEIKPNTTMTDNLLDLEKGKETKGTALGYILVLISMFLYASYEVFYGYLLQTDQDKHPAMTSLKFVGYLGLTTPVIFGICLPIWHFTGWETLELPSQEKVGLFLLSIILDAVFNIFLLLAIALSNPTLASVGQSLALPGSMVADFILHHFLLPWPALVGAGCVAVGFFGFVYEEMKHDSSNGGQPEDEQGLLETEESCDDGSPN